MKCPSCEFEVEQMSKFCPECGARLTDDNSEQAEAEQDAAFPVPGGNQTPRERFDQMVSSRQQDDDEEQGNVWSGSYSHKAMVGWWILAGVITVLGLIITLMSFAGSFWYVLLAMVIGWAILGARYAYRRLGVHYHLTSQRLIHEAGILWRRIDRIELIDIDDVTFRQGPIERMFKVGTVHISSSDKTDPEIDLPGIENVRYVADLIDDLRRKERRRRGLHIEAV